MPKQQRHVICDYITALSTEIKIADTYRQTILNTLITLAKSSSKAFKDFTRADVVAYMNYFRKDDSEDPKHKWIGTYNTNLVNVIKFFRWLYSPDIGPMERPKPAVVQNLHTFRRKETSSYDPSDMWDAEDNQLFLRYCPNPRDGCYHATEVDTGARPHEVPVNPNRISFFSTPEKKSVQLVHAVSVATNCSNYQPNTQFASICHNF